MPKIEPKILKGFRDFLPEKQITRQEMIAKIKASFEVFGFEPLETPALEYADVLTGKYGEEGDKLMYRFRDNGDRDVALRYDLTIPLARVVVQYGSEIKRPFKRYQISPVWRAENTQKGRFREFYQCDADIVGSTSPLSDAEILALSASVLSKLGLKPDDFVIRVNSREIISAFYDSLKLSPDEKQFAVRTVDKIDKIGKKGVEEELLKNKFSAEDVKAILDFAGTKIKNIKETGVAEKAFPAVENALDKLADIVNKALMLFPKARFEIDFSIARGLDYYTGMIFEASLTKSPQFGSVIGGGRYDNLVGMFSNKQVPAVGLSIGFDRLLSAFEEIGLVLVKEKKTIVEVLIVNFSGSLGNDYAKMASELREAGVNTLLYFETADIKKQLSYASDRGIPYALIYGPDEAKEGMVIVKNLQKGRQEKVKKADFVEYFFGVLQK